MNSQVLQSQTGLPVKESNVEQGTTKSVFPCSEGAKDIVSRASLKDNLIQAENQKHASKVFLHIGSFMSLNTGSISRRPWRSAVSFAYGHHLNNGGHEWRKVMHDVD